ncbi:IS5 family transposase [Streptomyces sp. NRRL WC-3725]|uniref:IS5 family transposase n=1 Tax=Streptomyces sp. NRRL WC-3725 TaxID=1463933 RepID=UPI000A7FC1E8|nr:IS5 family transposase [Streptomyces sp. NRRL WC-3725]
MTEAEWQVIRAVLPVPAWLEGRGGRPEGFCRRQMIDAVRYVADHGVKWANLPADFPPYRRVHAFARRWQVTGLLAKLHDRLRDKVRQKEGRTVDPTAAIVDSQSVRAAANIPRSTSGWDGGTKVGGRKRHLVVDCLGLVLAVAVTAASVKDRDAAVPLLERLRKMYFSIRLVWADGGYAGRLVDWAAEKLQHPRHRQTHRRHHRVRGAALQVGGGMNAELADALTSSGARLRDLARHARIHGAVVDDHAHEQPPGRTPPRCFQPAGTASGVNTPGRTWRAHPRSTRRFAFDRNPSTFAGTA